MKAHPATTYTKTETDNLLTPKATVSYVDNQLLLKANQATPYTKAETDNLLTPKANQATTYTKSETDNLLTPKATVSYVDNQLLLKAIQATTLHQN